MAFAFFDRTDELARLRRLLRSHDPRLAVLYGRRRCGKSRLLREVVPAGRTVAYVGDDREARLQRESLAREVARVRPGFDAVAYPEWEPLLDRIWEDVPPGTVLALDEFPALVGSAPELPGLLQKKLDVSDRRVHLVLCGSSQRMMQGLALDRTAPLYGRAHEILRIGQLPAGCLKEAFPRFDDAGRVEAYAVWGGVPRYWELAAELPGLRPAVEHLILDPRGILFEEPSALLLDDMRDTTQAASILSLVGRGCHRPSEIAARLGKPVTSLSRPLQRLVELGLLDRESPFGVSTRDSKRTLYRIGDPFLRFWFRFVDPNRSLIELGRPEVAASLVWKAFPDHVAGLWERLVRDSIPRLRLHGREWKASSRWWGNGSDRRPLEIDLVAESVDGGALLLGECEWTNRPDAARLAREIQRKSEVFPERHGREVFHLVACRRGVGKMRGEVVVLTPAEVIGALR